MGKPWQEWKKEQRRLAEERREKRKRPWKPPEQYYGEDEYKNIIFFTQGREALAKYEFYKTQQGKLLAMQQARLAEEEKKEKEMLEQFKKARRND